MNLILRFSPVLSAVILAMACGDDDDAGTPTPPKETACTAPYADLTESKLKAKIASTGKCVNDAPGICKNPLITATAACAIPCVTMHQDEAAQATCTLDCLEEGTDPTPSAPCLNCYIGSVSCAFQNCLNECIGGGESPGCIACRDENGCTEAFYECSGLPLPAGTPPNGNGGEGGTPNSNGGEPNTPNAGSPSDGGASGGTPASGGAGGEPNAGAPSSGGMSGGGAGGSGEGGNAEGGNAEGGAVTSGGAGGNN